MTDVAAWLIPELEAIIIARGEVRLHQEAIRKEIDALRDQETKLAARIIAAGWGDTPLAVRVRGEDLLVHASKDKEGKAGLGTATAKIL